MLPALSPSRVAFRPGPPTADPSNRWPWLALALGLLIVVVAAAVFLFNAMRTPTVAIVNQATPTPLALAPRTAVATAGPPPTLVAPTLPVVPSPTPLPSPTSVPVAAPPGATFLPANGSPQPSGPAPTLAPPPAVQTAAALTGQSAATPPPAGAPPAPAGAPAAPPAPTGAAPAAPPAATATAVPPPTAAPTAPPTAPPSPTPFSGQVAPAGGFGNTRQDLDAAVGPPLGETPGHLVVYRKNNLEEHVEFSPDPARAILIAVTPPTPVALDAAQPISRRFFPTDAQPRGGPPEGNAQFVVERFTSPRLGQALSPDLFQQRNGQPGDFLVVYLKNPQGAITRIVVGIGDDINALIQRSGQ